jgi:hypothetical protein
MNTVYCNLRCLSFRLVSRSADSSQEQAHLVPDEPNGTGVHGSHTFHPPSCYRGCWTGCGRLCAFSISGSAPEWRADRASSFWSSCLEACSGQIASPRRNRQSRVHVSLLGLFSSHQAKISSRFGEIWGAARRDPRSFHSHSCLRNSAAFPPFLSNVVSKPTRPIVTVRST